MTPTNSLGRAVLWRRIVAATVGVLALARAAAAQQALVPKHTPSEFAATISRLSEPGGYFDTDNLISNESSYLHPLGLLRELGVSGGAYIGVGPDQNFAYIAAIRPRIAYILDLRRDNLLQHLMFKALFERSRNRMDYMCRWLGRVPPADLASWDQRSIGDISAWIGKQSANPKFAQAEQNGIIATVQATGVPLSDQDAATIRRFHNSFVAGGLDLQFSSFNRGPRPYYPTLGQLILETDLAGKQASYLAREDDWRFVKSLQVADRIIPVIGNLAGTTALNAIGRDFERRGEKLSAVYTSNVEQYIWRDGSFPRFAENVASLPRDRRSVIIRSYFGSGSGGQPHPLARDGYYSTQLVQAVSDFVERHRNGGWTSYWELVTAGNR
jgi:hypothetical protein